jgi:AraC family transcriptional regulator of adaptative response/methylated-DNA-[protein]-cysteine methyltransferase
MDDVEAAMSEHVRYTWGQSSLGDFIAAVSAHGLVAFEFADGRTTVREALRARLPDAVLSEDRESLAELAAKLSALVDHPEVQSDIVLDPRGSDYQKQVWTMLREIPVGQTASYGALAAMLGARDARDVTEAIASNGIAILIPCHRVVKKDGSLSGYRWGFKRKRTLLERERNAVPFQLA